MPQRQTKFSETWLSSVDSNGQRIGEWCRKGQNEYQAYCQFCDVQVKCDNAGRTQLLQHSKQKKYIDAIKHSVDKKQNKLVAFSKQSGESSFCSSQSLGLITPGDSMNAEIFWLAKVSVSNLSLRSVDNIGDLFRAMFPDSKIEANFKLSRTSASYMIADGMSKYFTQLIVKDLVKSKLPFCIHFDETTSTQVKKQIDLTLRYWSPTHEEVWITYYTSLFFGHSEGEKVAVKMYEQLVSDGIPVAKLVTLVRDGPNHGSHWDWKSGKTWKNGKAFSSQGKVREFCQDWKSRGILPKILEKQENLNKKNVLCESQGILHKMLENQWI